MPKSREVQQRPAGQLAAEAGLGRQVGARHDATSSGNLECGLEAAGGRAARDVNCSGTGKIGAIPFSVCEISASKPATMAVGASET